MNPLDKGAQKTKKKWGQKMSNLGLKSLFTVYDFIN